MLKIKKVPSKFIKHASFMFTIDIYVAPLHYTMNIFRHHLARLISVF